MDGSNLDWDGAAKFVGGALGALATALGYRKIQSKQENASPSPSADRNQAEELARLIRETNTVLNGLCEEIRRYRDDQRAEHQDNLDSQRELRETIRDIRR